MRAGWKMSQAERDAVEMGASPVQTTEEREASGKALNSRVSMCRLARERRGATREEVLIFSFHKVGS